MLWGFIVEVRPGTKEFEYNIECSYADTTAISLKEGYYSASSVPISLYQCIVDVHTNLQGYSYLIPIDMEP